jgi:hypothetical protein
MTEAEHQQPHDQGLRSRWRSWFASTGAPPAWPLVGYLTAGLIAGAALSGDTIVGCAIALVATYLLWPRDKESEQTVPVPAT